MVKDSACLNTIDTNGIEQKVLRTVGQKVISYLIA